MSRTPAQLVAELLRQAPPGEQPHVAAALRVLLGSGGALVEGELASAAEAHNQEQLLAAALPDGGRLLVCADARLGDGLYLEPRSAAAVAFDHVARAAGDARPAQPQEVAPPTVEPFRLEVQNALEPLLRDVYSPHGAAAVFGSQEGGEARVTLCISSAELSSKNFWSGRVRSRWTVAFELPAGGGAGDARLTGELSAAVHYFEEGNVQLATSQRCTLPLPAQADAAEFAAAVLRAVRSEEAAYYRQLEETFDELAGGAFKELRRALPVTRTRFDWDKAQHKLAIELAAKERADATSVK